MIGNQPSLTNNVASKTISVTATAGQTLFTVTGGYRINQLSVYRNGVRLVDSLDYNARDGATVTLLVPADTSDVLEFQVFDDFRVADALNVNSGGTVNGEVTIVSAATTALLVEGNTRVTGILTVGNSSITLDGTSNSINVGSLNIAESGITGGTPDLNIRNITGVAATFTGNVRIAGTWTSEDVTNVDSIGLITARSGVVLTGGDITLGTGVTVSGATANTFNLSTNGSERLRITSAGLVGIGTRSPGAKLHVSSGASSALISSNADDLTVENSGNCGITIATPNTSTGTIRFADPQRNNSGGIYYDHSVDYLSFVVNAALAAIIDSSGRLLVGMSTASSVQGKVFVVGNSNSATGEGEIHLARGATPTSQQNLGNIHFGGVGLEKAAQIICKRDGGTWTSGASHPSRLEFLTTADGASSSTERMRIGQKGYLKVSNTGSYNDVSAKYHETRSDQDDWTLHVSNSHASNPYGLLVTHSTVKNNTSNWFLYAQEATTLRFQVRSNGGIANYQGNDTNLCDEREKKNIVDLDSTWNCLKNWELKKFHYNEDADTDDKRYGVIAQQVAEHCPEVITDWVKQQAEPAKLDEDGNELEPAKQEIVRMGVKEQQMYWMAIKALLEAQVRIEALDAEVAALKAS